jgi:MFS transporter, AAHS family, vanillate permease
MTTDPKAIIRDGPMTTFQIVVIVICTVLNMIDGFDVLSMPFTAPAIAKQWGVEPGALGVLLSAGLAGMSMGSLFLSPLADLIGRRAMVNLALLIVSTGMFAAAAAQGIWDLAAYRFLTGLGIGIVLSAGNTLLAEYSPSRWRDLSISAMVVGYPAGVIAGGFIAAWLIDHHGWRSAFAFGGACSALVLPFSLLYLPESLDFLLSGKTKNGLARVNAVLARFHHAPLDRLPEIAPEDRATKAVVGVFDTQFLPGTILICTSFFMLMLSFYFVLSWTTKNLVDLGFTQSEGIFASILLSAGGIAGGLSFGYIASKWHARSTVPYMLGLLFLAIVGYGAVHEGLVPVMTGAFVAGFFMHASMCGLYIIVPQIYPARVRNTGTGLAIGFGRMGAVVGPYLGGLLIAAGWERFAYYSVLAIPVLLSAAAVKYIPLFEERARDPRAMAAAE